MRRHTPAGGATLLVALLASASVAAAQTVPVTDAVVAGAHAAGQLFYEASPGSNAAIVNSPSRDGDGALQLHTEGTSGRVRLGYGKVYGNPPGLAQLDEITAASFDWFRSAVSTVDAHQAPAFRFHIWDGAVRSELIWEAVYNGYPIAGGGVPTNQWISTDLLSGTFHRWVAGGAGTTMSGGAQVNQSLSWWANPANTYFSANARITAISVGAGSWNGNFTGYVDQVRVGVNGRNVTADFQAPPPATVTPEPVSMALLGTGLVGVAAARRRRKNKA